jgi:hypothetical protein
LLRKLGDLGLECTQTVSSTLRLLFFRAQLTPQGTILIDGYIQLEKDGPVHGWTAEVSSNGKTLRDEVGAVELGERNSKP